MDTPASERATGRPSSDAPQVSDDTYRLLAENAADWVFWVDPAGNYLYSSPSCEAVTGYTPEEFAADSMLLPRIIHPDDLVIYTDHRDHELALGVTGLEFRIVAKDGKQKWLCHMCRPIFDADGHFLGSRGANRDVSERKRVEFELRDLTATLERRVEERTGELAAANQELAAANQELAATNEEVAVANEELACMNEELAVSNDCLMEMNCALSEATRAKTEFLRSMSHELRTPLNAIIGFSGILRQELAGPLNEEQHRQLSMVAAAGGHLLELVNQLLDLAQIESGRLTPAEGEFDLGELVDRVTGTVGCLAEEKGLELRREVPGPLGVMRSDAMRVEQILLNLLGNAIKFTEAGEVVLHASASGDSVTFAVADTGPGIAECELEYIFEEFAVVRPTDGAPAGGTGLGLAVSRRLARLLGGNVTVESEVGRGSNFTLTLPRTIAAPEPV